MKDLSDIERKTMKEFVVSKVETKNIYERERVKEICDNFCDSCYFENTSLGEFVEDIRIRLDKLNKLVEDSLTGFYWQPYKKTYEKFLEYINLI